MQVNVSVVQMRPKLYEKSYNLSKMEEFVKKIVSENKTMDLIIFPELITTGYECGKSFYKLAEVFPSGASINFIADLSRQYNTHIIFGFAEEDQNIKGVLYNSAALINNKGIPVGVYRKVHLFNEERKLFRAGCEYPVFNLEIGKIGMMICWDTIIPEVARIYALKGVDLLVVATNWENPYSKDWDLIASARALDNTVYLAAANRIGTDKKLSFFGHSKIIDPLGNVLSAIDEEIESYTSKQIDYNTIKDVRIWRTQLRDRREDTFALLSEKYVMPFP